MMPTEFIIFGTFSILINAAFVGGLIYLGNRWLTQRKAQSSPTSSDANMLAAMREEIDNLNTRLMKAEEELHFLNELQLSSGEGESERRGDD